MIRSECHSDDMVATAKFDATSWFEKATDQEIIDLAMCGFGGDYPADAVADFVSEVPGYDDVSFMYAYIQRKQRTESIGFECHVDGGDAMVWLDANRPAIAARIRTEAEENFQVENAIGGGTPYWDGDTSWSGDYQTAATPPSP